MVTNLDTGEVIPLSAAEEKIPQGHGWSPLSEHLLQRTKEIAEALVSQRQARCVAMEMHVQGGAGWVFV